MTVMTDIEIADPRVEQYAVEHTTPEPPWFATLAEETRNATRAPTMMVGTLEGRLLTALVAMLRPRSVLEIGTFTGYSALSMAEALPADGRIITCDISEEHVAIARRHIAASPYAERDRDPGPARRWRRSRRSTGRSTSSSSTPTRPATRRTTRRRCPSSRPTA